MEVDDRHATPARSIERRHNYHSRMSRAHTNAQTDHIHTASLCCSVVVVGFLSVRRKEEDGKRRNGRCTVDGLFFYRAMILFFL